ncbi:MAG: MMPL family transporter [Bacteroidales bacterium]|nr:MMPL family transporter [Bacteroidales bacterium]
MHRIFIPIYRFFQKHKGLMYALMLGSFIFFTIFGVRIQLKEEIVKLLPDSALNNELAFTEVAIKDKVFIQLLSAEGADSLSTKQLGKYMDKYISQLSEADSSSHLIKEILYKLDADMALGAMDYAFNHVPSFVDTSLYKSIDKAMSLEEMDRQMALNYELVMEDEEGTATTMVATDPLNLREVLLGSVMPSDGSVGAYVIDEGHFFCKDKSVALAFMSPNFDGMDSRSATRLLKTFQKATKAFESENPEVKVYYFGNALGGASNAGTLKRDLFKTVGLSLIIILVFILLCFHDWSFIWQQVVPVAYGTAFAAACMFWIKSYMSLMALGLGAIVLGVAISYCLHVLIHFYYVGDAERMLREESTPVFLGCLTTIGAFSGLFFTESEMLRDFGMFATFALIGNTFFALVFLPHFLKPGQVKFKKTKGFPLIEHINSLPWDRNKPFLISLVVFILVGIIFSPRVKFDNDLRNLDYHLQFLKDGEALYNEKNTDGCAHQFFANYSDNLDEALDANQLLNKHLDSLQKEGVISYYDKLIPAVMHSERVQNERIDAWNKYWTAEKKAQLRRNLAASASKYDWQIDFTPFYALLDADYAPGNVFEEGVLPPELMSNFIEKEASGRYMVFTQVDYLPENMNKATAEVIKSPRTLVLDPFYYCIDLVQLVHDDFNTTLWISSVFVLLVLLFSFGNLATALLAFLPMGISWFVLQGYMAIFGLQFNLINIVISTFIFGIGVDYSIFVMEGLLKEARTGDKDMLSFHKVAIFFSALVLIIVVCSLIFATHTALSSIGVITLIGMASTILITYSLQPFVFRQLLKIPYFRRRFRVER